MAFCLQLSDRNFGCGVPNDVFGEIIEAKIVNAEDITSWSASNRNEAIWVTGEAGIRIQVVNNSCVLSIATKGGETYNLAYDPTITIVSSQEFDNSAPNVGGVSGDQRFVIALKFVNGKHIVVGLGAPLSLLSVEGANNASPSATLTFGVEDWQTGTTIYGMTESAYNG